MCTYNWMITLTQIGRVSLNILLGRLMAGYAWINAWYQHAVQLLQLDWGAQAPKRSVPSLEYDMHQYAIMVEFQTLETTVDLTKAIPSVFAITLHDAQCLLTFDGRNCT